MDKSMSKGFTLVEGLVVVVIIVVLAALLIFGIRGATGRGDLRRLRTRTMITGLMMALEGYHTAFGSYPPGGFDANGNGNMTDAGDNLGSGTDPSTWADIDDPTVDELQLRTICMTLKRRNKDGVFIGTTEPFFNASKRSIVNGAVVDAWGNPLCYLVDGSNKFVDPTTGVPLIGRVVGRKPVIWSLGRDGKQAPGNNGKDDDANGKVDDPDEVDGDICSWHR